MNALEVILIASQLAFVICLPQEIRFVQSNQLRPTEVVSLDSHHRVFPSTIYLSDRNRNDFLPVEAQPHVQFTEPISANPGEFIRIVEHVISPGESSGGILEGAFYPQAVNQGIDQRQRFVSVPSGQEVDKDQRQQQANQQIFVFRDSVDRNERQPLHGVKQEIPSDAPISGIDRPLQVKNDAETINVSQRKRVDEKKTSGSSRFDASLVTRLTAPSSDSRFSNTLLIKKKPCEICCAENEVEPCKNCCAHTPLLNVKTLKTAVG